MEQKQRQNWETFVSELTQLNKRFYITKGRAYLLTKTLEWYKKETKTLPTVFNFEEIAHYQRVFKKYAKAVRSLNNALALSQSGHAVLAPSQNFPGDLDLIADQKRLSESEVKNATFWRPDLPTEKDLNMGVVIAPIIPLLVKGAIFIGGAVVVSGIVNAVTESNVAQKRIEKEIVAIQAKVESEIAENPDLFAKWAEYKKKTLAPIEKTFWQSFGEQLGQGMGPAIGIALVAVVGLFLFKQIEGKKKK